MVKWLFKEEETTKLLHVRKVYKFYKEILYTLDMDNMVLTKNCVDWVERLH